MQEAESTENLQWAELISNEIFFHVATQCIRYDAPTFTVPQLKNMTQFMVHHENILKLAVNFLLQAGKVHLPPDARGRILTYTVDRAQAANVIPKEQEVVVLESDSEVGDDEDVTEDEKEEGGYQADSRVTAGVSGKRKKKRRAKTSPSTTSSSSSSSSNSGGSASKQPRSSHAHDASHKSKKGQSNSSSGGGDEDFDDDVLPLPSYHPPPPPIRGKTCPVSDECLVAVMACLSQAPGGEMSKLALLEELCGPASSDDASLSSDAPSASLSRDDVELALVFLQDEKNKIMLDDDDIHIL